MLGESRTGKVNIVALAASAVVHVIVLGCFGFMELSNVNVQKTPSNTAVVIADQQDSFWANKIYEKPKVFKKEVGDLSDQIIEIDNISVAEIATTSNETVPLKIDETIINSLEPTFYSNAEFYGSKSVCKRICFVVDGSGSMQGQFNSVKSRLINSITALQQDQYFAVIFYNHGRILKVPDQDYFRASRRNIEKAKAFIHNIVAGGKTIAKSSLEAALRISGKYNGDSVIFFLTDGFELFENEQDGFIDQMVNFQRTIASRTAINTIGFRGNEKSNEILRQIAEKTGGEFVLAD